MARIGITTTVPVEILFAAGHTPVDLNNIFITSPDPGGLIESAELRGFPRNLCSWVKGMYGILQGESRIDEIIAVIEGDCSNSCALMEIAEHEGRMVHPFSYPFDRSREKLCQEMERLMALWNISWNDVSGWKARLDKIRAKALEIDRLTWLEGVVSGFENHYYLINTSDFMGNSDAYNRELDLFLATVGKRSPEDHTRTRLGLAGVPPIFSNLYQVLEERGARIYYSEVPRQFAMPSGGSDLVEQYLNYTYPYGIRRRAQDIEVEAEKRRLQGIIHYTQMFCHHQMDHMVLKERIGLPMLLLEGDRPGLLDERTMLRIESFLEMIR
jgi:benzoyl-CoA reductase/2-hydroxyglutaryl-CoA dehydratase subunit BcrC/BadD/HgdB